MITCFLWQFYRLQKSYINCAKIYTSSINHITHTYITYEKSEHFFVSKNSGIIVEAVNIISVSPDVFLCIIRITQLYIVLFVLHYLQLSSTLLLMSASPFYLRCAICGEYRVLLRREQLSQAAPRKLYRAARANLSNSYLAWGTKNCCKSNNNKSFETKISYMA